MNLIHFISKINGCKISLEKHSNDKHGVGWICLVFRLLGILLISLWLLSMTNDSNPNNTSPNTIFMNQILDRSINMKKYPEIKSIKKKDGEIILNSGSSTGKND